MRTEVKNAISSHTLVMAQKWACLQCLITSWSLSTDRTDGSGYCIGAESEGTVSSLPVT